MNKKINDMVSLGYTNTEVLEITRIFPKVFSLNIEPINKKMNNMIKLGYTKEEVIKIKVEFPSIYGASIKNINQKIKFYDTIGMHELAIKDTKQLIQSIHLSYARYMFYQSIGINIDMNNYGKLFMNQNKFKKAYGITNKEVLEKYKYYYNRD